MPRTPRDQPDADPQAADQPALADQPDATSTVAGPQPAAAAPGGAPTASPAGTSLPTVQPPATGVPTPPAYQTAGSSSDEDRAGADADPRENPGDPSLVSPGFAGTPTPSAPVGDFGGDQNTVQVKANATQNLGGIAMVPGETYEVPVTPELHQSLQARFVELVDDNGVGADENSIQGEVGTPGGAPVAEQT